LKKLISSTLSSLTLILSLQLNAQTKAGVKAGYNHSTQKNYSATDGFHSYHLGAVYQLTLKENWRSQIELNYSIKGTKWEYSSLKMNYLDIPLLFGYQFKKFNLNLGVQYSILFSAKQLKEGKTLSENDGNSSSLAGLIDLNYSLSKKLRLGSRWVNDFFYQGLNYENWQKSTKNTSAQSSQDPNVQNPGVIVGKANLVQVYLLYYLR